MATSHTVRLQAQMFGVKPHTDADARVVGRCRRRVGVGGRLFKIGTEAGNPIINQHMYIFSSVHVCLYFCTPIRMYACSYTCMPVPLCPYAPVPLCPCALAPLCSHVCVLMSMHLCTHVLCTLVPMHLYNHAPCGCIPMCSLPSAPLSSCQCV